MKKDIMNGMLMDNEEGQVAVPHFSCDCRICQLQIENGHHYEVRKIRKIHLF